MKKNYFMLVMYSIQNGHKVLAKSGKIHSERIIHLRWISGFRYLISGSYDNTCVISSLSLDGKKI